MSKKISCILVLLMLFTMFFINSIKASETYINEAYISGDSAYFLDQPSEANGYSVVPNFNYTDARWYGGSDINLTKYPFKYSNENYTYDGCHLVEESLGEFVADEVTNSVTFGICADNLYIYGINNKVKRVIFTIYDSTDGPTNPIEEYTDVEAKITNGFVFISVKNKYSFSGTSSLYIEVTLETITPFEIGEEIISGSTNVSIIEVSSSIETPEELNPGFYFVKFWNSDINQYVCTEMFHVHNFEDGFCSLCDKEDHSGYIKWTDSTTLPTSAGCYYLATDVTLSANYTINKNINLDLCGHVINTSAATISLSANYIFIIHDSNPNAKHKGYLDDTGLFILSNEIPDGKKVTNLYGGLFYGAGRASTSPSSGAFTLSSGMFCVHGGTFAGYKATASTSGVFYLSSAAELHIYNGDFVGNITYTASHSVTSANYNGLFVIENASGNEYALKFFNGLVKHTGTIFDVKGNSKINVYGGYFEATSYSATSLVAYGEILFIDNGFSYQNITENFSNCILKVKVNGQKSASLFVSVSFYDKATLNLDGVYASLESYGSSYGLYSYGSMKANINNSTIDIKSTGGTSSDYIYAVRQHSSAATAPNNDYVITNSVINVTGVGDVNAYGIYMTNGAAGATALKLNLDNSTINVTGSGNAYGIYGTTNSGGNTVQLNGSINVTTTGSKKVADSVYLKKNTNLVLYSFDSNATSADIVFGNTDNKITLNDDFVPSKSYGITFEDENKNLIICPNWDSTKTISDYFTSNTSNELKVKSGKLVIGNFYEVKYYNSEGVLNYSDLVGASSASTYAGNLPGTTGAGVSTSSILNERVWVSSLEEDAVEVDLSSISEDTSVYAKYIEQIKPFELKIEGDSKTYYSLALNDAINKNNDNTHTRTIKLLADVSASADTPLNIFGNLTIDLNGHDLAFTGTYTIDLSSSTLTSTVLNIIDTSTDKITRSYRWNDSNKKYYFDDLTTGVYEPITGGALILRHDSGIIIGENGTTLNVEANILSVSAAISCNESSTNSPSTINVKAGKIVANGISSSAAIDVKTNVLVNINISGGSVVYNCTKFDSGAAIRVGTGGAANININGGNVYSSYNAINVSSTSTTTINIGNATVQGSPAIYGTSKTTVNLQDGAVIRSFGETPCIDLYYASTLSLSGEVDLYSPDNSCELYFRDITEPAFNLAGAFELAQNANPIRFKYNTGLGNNKVVIKNWTANMGDKRPFNYFKYADKSVVLKAYDGSAISTASYYVNVNETEYKGASTVSNFIVIYTDEFGHLDLSSFNPTKAEDDKYTYEFSHYRTADSETAITGETVFTKTTTIYPVFNAMPKSFNIIYKDFGNQDYSGPEIDDSYKQYTYGTQKTLPTVTKTGYNLLGFVLEANGSSIISCLPDTTFGDVTVYAVWEAKTYNITFDANISDANEGCGTVEYGSNKILITVAPDSSIYKPAAYYTETNGGGLLIADANGNLVNPWTYDSNITLYPTWEVKSFEIFVTVVSEDGIGKLAIAGEENFSIMVPYGTITTVEASTIHVAEDTYSLTPENGYIIKSVTGAPSDNIVKTDIEYVVTISPRNDIPYVVKVYQETLDNEYELITTEDKVGTSNQEASCLEYEAHGFKAPRIEGSNIIKADGTSVFDVYLDRETFYVTYYNFEESRIEEFLMKYGTVLELPAVEKEHYIYTGWSEIDSEGNETILESSTYTALYSAMVVPSFEPEQYKVTFNLEHVGKVVYWSEEDSSYVEIPDLNNFKVFYNEYIDLYVYAEEGYELPYIFDMEFDMDTLSFKWGNEVIPFESYRYINEYAYDFGQTGDPKYMSIYFENVDAEIEINIKCLEFGDTWYSHKAQTFSKVELPDASNDYYGTVYIQNEEEFALLSYLYTYRETGDSNELFGLALNKEDLSEYDKYIANYQFVLEADLDLSDYYWTPMYAFDFYLNGLGHTISGINVKSYKGADSCLGLIGYVVNGCICNIKLNGEVIVDYKGSDEVLFVGGIAGVGENLSIFNVDSTFNIKATVEDNALYELYVGNLFGNISQSSISSAVVCGKVEVNLPDDEAINSPVAYISGIGYMSSCYISCIYQDVQLINHNQVERPNYMFDQFTCTCTLNNLGLIFYVDYEYEFANEVYKAQMTDYDLASCKILSIGQVVEEVVDEETLEVTYDLEKIVSLVNDTIYQVTGSFDGDFSYWMYRNNRVYLNRIDGVAYKKYINYLDSYDLEQDISDLYFEFKDAKVEVEFDCKSITLAGIDVPFKPDFSIHSVMLIDKELNPVDAALAIEEGLITFEGNKMIIDPVLFNGSFLGIIINTQAPYLVKGNYEQLDGTFVVDNSDITIGYAAYDSNHVLTTDLASIVNNPTGFHYNELHDEEFTLSTIPVLTVDYYRNRHTLKIVYGNGLEDLVMNDVMYEKFFGDQLLFNILKTGYSLNDYHSQNGDVNLSVMPDYDLVLTADWVPNVYTMNFYVDGSLYGVITQGYETSVTALENPTKVGHTFARWNPEVPAKMPLNGGSYYAEWTVNIYKATFVFNNGQADYEANCGYQESFELPSNPIKAGYEFDGWFFEDGTKLSSTTMPAEDIKLYAKWVHLYHDNPDKTWLFDNIKHYVQCAYCEQQLDAAYHTLNSSIIEEATCIKAGRKQIYCEVCGYSYEEIIPATDHSYCDWFISKPVTCTEDGIKSSVCERCGDTKTDVIRATGHLFGQWTVTKEATTSQIGQKNRICSICGLKEVEDIPMLPKVSKKKKGCKSSITVSIISSIALISMAAFIAGKKKNYLN